MTSITADLCTCVAWTPSPPPPPLSLTKELEAETTLIKAVMTLFNCANTALPFSQT